MKRWAPIAIAAAIVAVGALAGGNGVGSGGLNGFPAPSPQAAGFAILDGGPISATTVTATTVNATTVNGGFFDGGVYGFGRGVSCARGAGNAVICYADLNVPTPYGFESDYLIGHAGLSLNLLGKVTTTGTARAVVVDNTNTLGAGDGLQSWKNNGSEKVYFYSDGSLVITTEGPTIAFGPDTYCTEIGTQIVCTAATGMKMSSFTLTNLADKTTAPTVTSCTSPTMTWNNGNAAFQFDVGGTCTGVSTAVITLPTATNGWECKCTNITAPSTRVIDSSAWSTTTVTVTNYSRTLGTAADFTDGTDIRCICRGG